MCTSNVEAERAQPVDHVAHGRAEQRGLVVGRDDDRDHGPSGETAHHGAPDARSGTGAPSAERSPELRSAAPCGSARRAPSARRGASVAAMPDVLKLHADGSPDRLAVIVDASHGAQFSTTTFAELNALVNRLAHGLLRARRRAGRPDRLVRTELARDRSRSIHAARKAGLVAVPLSYRFTADEMAVRHRQLRRDARGGRRRLRRRSSRRCATGSRRCGRASASAPPSSRTELPAGFVVVGRRRSRRASRRGAVGARRVDGRRADALHLGHHRQAEGRAAHRHERDDRVRAARRARLPDGQRGPHHHRADVPLRPARVRVAQPLGRVRRSSCCAASTRRRGSTR